MAHIDALVDKVAEPALRAALREQVATLLDRRSFGLVFQEHRPETVELPQHRVRRGGKVRVRDEAGQVLYRVQKLNGHDAVLASLTEPPAQRTLPKSDLVVVREFGDAVYPGLVSTGRVGRGGDKPAHVVINAENFHALETLIYTHERQIDAIYIDPPYNTREKDWKYNNDYVDSDDVYRHSKWLAMMQRRLQLAKRLVNPEDAVLIVTIDEKEYLRLGLLLEQTFPEARIQMISSIINPKGATRSNSFGRTDEYVYFVMFGFSAPRALPLPTEWRVVRDARSETLRWAELLRSGTNAIRADRPNLFYPVYARLTAANEATFASVGQPLSPDGDRLTVRPPEGCVAIWPIRSGGQEGRWELSHTALAKLIDTGYARLGRWREDRTAISYLKRGEQIKVEDGSFPILGNAADGSIVVDTSGYTPVFVPGTQWRTRSHEAGGPGGSGLLPKLLPERKFPFPKSLYAVEDALRFFVSDKPDAVVLDFFAGSGTTAHAVARLNREDDGRRQCLLVTNNEVSDQEARVLAAHGHRPGDDAWETLGICEFITKPRIEAALTGQTHLGAPVAGNYTFSDCFPMSEGLAENAEFFNLTYEDPDLISLGKKFEAIAPLLWLKAGGCGAILETVVEPWAMRADARYAVLFDTDQWREFVTAVAGRPDLKYIFVVTDSDSTFQQVIGELPRHLGCTQLYEDYLHNFQINTRECR